MPLSGSLPPAANGARRGVALGESLEPKSQNPRQTHRARPGVVPEGGGPGEWAGARLTGDTPLSLASTGHHSGRADSARQQETGPSLSAAGRFLQRKDAWLPQE